LTQHRPSTPAWVAARSGSFATSFALVFLCCLAFFYATYEAPLLPRVKVRWSPEIAEAQREALERTYALTEPEYDEGQTWSYALRDFSSDNIRQLVEDSAVQDTHEINRATYELTSPAPRQPLIVIRFLWLPGLLALVTATSVAWVGSRRWKPPGPLPFGVPGWLDSPWLHWLKTQHLRRLTPFLWIAYLLIPAEGWGLFDGRPLGPAETMALAAVMWLWHSRGPLLGPLVALALVGKIALGTTLLAPRGFDARYYANPNFLPPAERSLDPTRSGVTRIDERLRFGTDGAADLPVYFLNDPQRFNFYESAQPDRATLPVSVTWTGSLRVEESGPQQLYARTSAGTAVMTVGTAVNTIVTPSSAGWTDSVNLSPGHHRVLITLTIPQGGSRHFEAGRVVNGREQPFDSRVIFRRPVTALTLMLDRAARVLGLLLDLVLAGWLAVGTAAGVGQAWHRLRSSFALRDALALAAVPVTGEALVWAVTSFETMITLSGGDDWLVYEALGRDIALNGLWMTNGAALGQGAAFYFQPLYPYFVAACHWLFGDSLFGVYFLQRLLVGATVVALWRSTPCCSANAWGLAVWPLLAYSATPVSRTGPILCCLRSCSFPSCASGHSCS